MGDVINFSRKSAIFNNEQRMYYAQRLKHHGIDERNSELAVAAMETEMCEAFVAKARQVARIVGHRLGKRLFRLITKL